MKQIVNDYLVAKLQGPTSLTANFFAACALEPFPSSCQTQNLGP
jgi:hypothetical protein